MRCYAVLCGFKLSIDQHAPTRLTSRAQLPLSVIDVFYPGRLTLVANLCVSSCAKVPVSDLAIGPAGSIFRRLIQPGDRVINPCALDVIEYHV